MSPGLYFDQAFRYGMEFTKRLAGELEADGWSVVKTDKIETDKMYEGPRQQVGNRHCRIPDLQVTKNYRTVYIEGKRKAQRSPGRISRKDEHGIDWDAYQDYLALDGGVMPVFVAFNDDEHPEEVLIFKVSTVSPRFSDERRHHGEGMPAMAYFVCERMEASWLEVLNRFVTRPLFVPEPAIPLSAVGWGPCDQCAHWMLLGEGLPTACVVCRSAA